MKTAHGRLAVIARTKRGEYRCTAFNSLVTCSYSSTAIVSLMLLHCSSWLVLPNRSIGQDSTSIPPTVLVSDSPAALSPPAVPASESTPAPVSEPLNVRIDSLLKGDIELLVAPKAADGELLRRLSLDLRGVVPTREELDAFVADQATDRWANWVHRLLADPLCDEHLVSFFDRTLMLRRPHTQVDRTTWLNYLREQVAANVPLDQLSKQLLYSPWWHREQRTAQKFFLDRGGDSNLIARDIGRVFLGRDMQCAQCHDHPLVDDYKQIDYHGIAALVAPSKMAEATYKDAEGKDQKVQLYIEQAAGDAAFESVFDKGIPFRSGPRLPGQTEYFEDYLLPDDRYLAAAPADALAGVAIPPKQSRRNLLAQQLTARTNRPFVSNWANRLWALVFGQGLVQPIDMQHAGNPPSHPLLFALITDGLLECDMQPRKFLAELVLSQAYQRGDFTLLQTTTNSSVPLSLSAEQAQAMRTVATAKLAELSASHEVQKANEATSLATYEAAREAWRSVQAQRAAIRTELDAAEAAMLGAKKKSTEADAALAVAKKRQTDTATRITLLEEAVVKLQQAADLLGSEDAELKQAIAVSKQRADASRGQVPEIDKLVADAQAAAAATVPGLQQATAKVQEIAAKLAPIHIALQAADTSMLDARAKWFIDESSLKHAERNATRFEHVLAWLDSQEASELKRGEANQIAQSVASIEGEIQPATDLVALAQTQLQASQSSLQQVTAELTMSSVAMEQQTADRNQLQQSLDSLATTSKLIGAPESLALAQQTIQSEIEKRSLQVGQLQASVAMAQQAVASASARATQCQQELDARQVALQQVNLRLTAARESAATKQAELTAVSETIREHWSTVRDDGIRHLDTAGLYPLSPEQLCWSTLRVMGQLEAHIDAELAELQKQSPLAEDADAATKAARHRQAVRSAYDKLRGNVDVFVALYASGPDKTQDDFFASADQALYTANAGNVFSWAGPGNNNVTQQVLAMADNAQIAQTIYWTLLCRQPTADETALITEQIAASGENRQAVIQEMVWGLLASAEFRFCR